ncbi:MAG: response regulator [Cyanobacteria bacterium P01_D01_bin.1]
MDIHTTDKQPKILVVDDRLENLQLLKKLLTEEGYSVRQSPDGALALSNIPRFQPDLVLLDIMMPEMDGYTVCQNIKSNEQSKDIPVIFLSALDLTFDKVKAFESGGADYISKPFHPAEVIVRVKNQLKMRQQSLQADEQQSIIQTQKQRIDELEQSHQRLEAAYRQSIAQK